MLVPRSPTGESPRRMRTPIAPRTGSTSSPTRSRRSPRAPLSSRLRSFSGSARPGNGSRVALALHRIDESRGRGPCRVVRDDRTADPDALDVHAVDGGQRLPNGADAVLAGHALNLDFQRVHTPSM